MKPGCQRRMLPGDLLSVRLPDDVVADRDQEPAQILAGCSDVSDQGAGKGRVAASPVQRDVAGLRGKTDERAAAGFDRGKPASDRGRSRSERAGKIAGQRVV